jgi:hypothetical protein
MKWSFNHVLMPDRESAPLMNATMHRLLHYFHYLVEWFLIPNSLQLIVVAFSIHHYSKLETVSSCMMLKFVVRPLRKFSILCYEHQCNTILLYICQYHIFLFLKLFLSLSQ